MYLVNYFCISADGKKNSVPVTEEKHTGKSTVVAFTPIVPPNQRNLTNVTTTVTLVGSVTRTTTIPDVSNTTQSSALDNAHLQRTLLKPKFLTENSSTVVAQTGASSRISCLVANLGDCVVSHTIKISQSNITIHFRD